MDVMYSDKFVSMALMAIDDRAAFQSTCQMFDVEAGRAYKYIKNLTGKNNDETVTPEVINIDLLAALGAVMPWAAKAVADHYNQKQGKKALDMARAAIARVEGES